MLNGIWSILWMESALEIWRDLKERFYQGDIFRFSDLWEEIYTLKQGDNSISSYYTKMKKHWQELDNFRPIPTSNCVEDCKVIAKMREYKYSDQVISFLKGFKEQFSEVRSQIMLMDPLPSIRKVYSLLVLQERHLIVPLDESKFLALSCNSFSGNSSYGKSNMNTSRGRGGRSSGGRGKGIRVCSFCGKSNHTVDTCFKKHGFPPHYQQESSNNCSNVSGNEEENNIAVFEHDQSNSTFEKCSFTYAQYKALLAFLQNSSTLQPHSLNDITTNNALGSWIICIIPSLPKYDTFILYIGATYHMCFSRKKIQCMKRVNPINIKLPNGSMVSTSFTGTIVFSPDFYLTEVLYFPQFSFNLIYVPKLTKNISCKLFFDDTKCLIHAKLSHKIIDPDEMQDGLYILRSPLISIVHTPSLPCINIF